MRLQLSVFALAALLMSGCAALRSARRPVRGGGTAQDAITPPTPPTLRLVETRLSHAPTNEQIGLHYCTVYASQSPAGAFGALACRAFGPLPTREDLQFRFQAEMEAANPGRVPLPMVEALVAFKAFPDSGDSANLGAVCLSLCENPANCPQGGANACESTAPEIRDMDSFARAAVGFLVSVAVGQRRFEDLRIRTIQPNERIRFVAELSLDIDQTLSLIERTVRRAVDGAQRGQTPNIQIPYEVEGSVFVEVESFGRFAASFPAVAGNWDLAQLAQNTRRATR